MHTMCLIVSPFENDSPNDVLSSGHREEGLLPAQTEKSVHQLLFLSPRIAQMESLSQRFEIRSGQEIESLPQVLKFTLYDFQKQQR